jgi:hypothetical protein
MDAVIFKKSIGDVFITIGRARLGRDTPLRGRSGVANLRGRRPF